MVDVHGGLVPGTRVVEWEGTPQSVAFYYPYVIGFDNRFIEVRNVETVSIFFYFYITRGCNIKFHSFRVSWCRYWQVSICAVYSLLINPLHR
jgi:hypothetical protein